MKFPKYEKLIFWITECWKFRDSKCGSKKLESSEHKFLKFRKCIRCNLFQIGVSMVTSILVPLLGYINLGQFRLHQFILDLDRLDGLGCDGLE
jgi:hypothetical protein